MRLRTFHAPDMPAAMKLVRDTLGDDAIILTSEAAKGHKGVHVTAAIEEDEDSAPRSHARPAPQDHSNIDHLRFELRNILHFHNMPELFVAKLMQKATGKELGAIVAQHKRSGKDDKHLYRQALEELIRSYFMFEPLTFSSPSSGEAGRGGANGKAFPRRPPP